MGPPLVTGTNSIALYGDVIRRMRPYLRRFALVIGGVIATGVLEVLKPWPLKIVIDNVLRGIPMNVHWIPATTRPVLLIAACVGLVVLYLMHGILTVLDNYGALSIGSRMVNDLRGQIFQHLQKQSLAFHRRRESGDLMVRIGPDSTAIQTIAVNGIFPVLGSIVMLAGMFIVMIRLDPILTIVAMAVVPSLYLAISFTSRRMSRAANAARVKESRVYTIAQQTLSAIQVVQAFGQEHESYRAFADSSGESMGETLRVYFFQNVFAVAVSLMVAVGTASTIYLGARQVMNGVLSLGDLVVFTAYLTALYVPINTMCQSYALVETANAGFRRCLELLAIEPEIADRPDARNLGAATGAIEFDHVNFAYEIGRPVLTDISFQIAPGQRVAIVGPSGSGKTTLAALLARFYEPQSGAIRVDGADVHGLTLESLRRNVAMVLQPTLILGDTVRANIAIGRSGASQRQIETAARLARLEPVLTTLPRGIDEAVGAGGHSLSEGEAQRVTIARALLKDAPILIMDEPTSALDAETEALVMDAVEEAMRGRTTMVIAHRLSTIRYADLILVLRGGRVIEQGNFDELTARGGFFSHLYEMQTRGDAPADV